MRTIIFCVVMVITWASGFVGGYYMRAVNEHHPRRTTFIDRMPPPCLMQPTRDQRHVCEWLRVGKP